MRYVKLKGMDAQTVSFIRIVGTMQGDYSRLEGLRTEVVFGSLPDPKDDETNVGVYIFAHGHADMPSMELSVVV